MADEDMVGCCLTLSIVVHSSGVLVFLWARYLSLSEYLRSEVVSLMRS